MENGEFLKDLGSDLFNNAVYQYGSFIFLILWRIFREYLERQTEVGEKFSTELSLISVGLYWFVSIFIFFGLVHAYPSHSVTLFIILSMVLFGIAVRKTLPLSKLRSVGIDRAELQVNKGTNYKKALNLCYTELAFLGVGASKLTELSSFEEAVKRCQQHGGAVKLLLSKPDNQLIALAAKRAKRNEKEYHDKIITSLRRIAEIRNNGNYSIEVRFYADTNPGDYQQFRLMFIDNKTCLLSYTIWGEGDGSQIPQLILKNKQGSVANRTFYFPLKSYFERMWDEGEAWDFTTYI